MEDAFIIKGGRPLKGTVRLSGAKNVALKVIIASLLLDGEVFLENVPQIGDIEELLHLLTDLGVKTQFAANKLTLDTSSLATHEVDLLHGSKTRVSFMLFAPLLYRFGQSKIPNPGGCRIGARPIDRHIGMMKDFGVAVSYDSSTGFYSATVNGEKICPTTHHFKKPTHTGTELAIMFAVCAKGKSTIENAAREPEIDDFIAFLKACGADINKENGNIIVNGGVRLHPPKKPFAIPGDRNEAVTYAIAALATKGDITVEGIRSVDISYFLEKVREIGGGVDIVGNGLRFYHKGELHACQVQTRPHPGFMTDWQAPWAVLMTQAEGESVIHETVFEGRFSNVRELRKLGAHIEFFTPPVDNPESLYQFTIENPEQLTRRKQAIRIFGPTKLHNGVLEVADLRAGASLIIAAAVATGESVVNGATIIERGYERIDQKLMLLGCEIRKA